MSVVQAVSTPTCKDKLPKVLGLTTLAAQPKRKVLEFAYGPEPAANMLQLIANKRHTEKQLEKTLENNTYDPSPLLQAR